MSHATRKSLSLSKTCCQKADSTFFKGSATMAYLATGHVRPLPSVSCLSIQQIADALAGAGLAAVSLDHLEVAAIRNALIEFRGNRTHAAKVLGISVRTLQRKLKSLDRPMPGE